MEVALAKYFGIRKYIIVPNVSWGFGMHECDLFLIKKTGFVIEIEIKVSKSDLLADFKKGHRHKDRQNRITEFYYAIPSDLISSCYDLIPKEAGVIVCERFIGYNKENIVRTYMKRKAPRIKNSRKLTLEEQLKIARLGCMRIWSLKQKIIKIQ
jgi:hypothetical protein